MVSHEESTEEITIQNNTKYQQKKKQKKRDKKNRRKWNQSQIQHLRVSGLSNPLSGSAVSDKWPPLSPSSGLALTNWD